MLDGVIITCIVSTPQPRNQVILEALEPLATLRHAQNGRYPLLVSRVGPLKPLRLVAECGETVATNPRAERLQKLAQHPGKWLAGRGPFKMKPIAHHPLFFRPTLLLASILGNRILPGPP